MLFLSASIAKSQWVPIDSVVAQTVSSFLGGYSEMHITFDSSLQPLSPFVVSFKLGPELHVTHLTATLDTSTLAPTLHVTMDAVAHVNETRHWSSDIQFFPGADSRALALETNRSRFVELKAEPSREGSVWSDVVEPALVLIGAGAIVALFFLIRS